MLDEDPEGAAPVTDVVLAHDFVAEEREHAHQRVADDGGAQVADVQLLGEVRRRVVDQVAVARRGGDAEAVVAGDVAEDPAENDAIDRQVDEAGPGDLCRGHTVEVGGGDDVAGDIAGISAEPLGECQGAVGLGIGAVRRPDDRVDA